MNMCVVFTSGRMYMFECVSVNVNELSSVQFSETPNLTKIRQKSGV